MPDPQKIFATIINAMPSLAIGKYYWNIGSVPEVKIIAVGGDIENLTPFTQRQWLGASPEFAFSAILPEDMPFAMAYVMKLDQYLKKINPEKRKHIKASIYCRMKDKQGVYNWFCIQYPGFYFDNNTDNLLYVLSLACEISHLNPVYDNPFLTILDTSDSKQKLFTCHNPEKTLSINSPTVTVSKREQEVIRFLTQGKSSKQIADELNISKNTVDNHRQKLLHKLNVSSTAELIAVAIKNGLL